MEKPGNPSCRGEFSEVPHRLLYDPPSKMDFPPRSSNWRRGLRNVLSSVERSNRPAEEENPIVLFKNEKYVCTYDMYPKANYHLLLMRRENEQRVGNLSRVRTLNDLEPSHLRELREFHALGRNIASRLEEFRESDRTANNANAPIAMKLGYHAIPSFEPLHLHIISSDLDSPCITKREHIVSFASPFFVDPGSLERHLESAFANSVRLSVRKERAQALKRNAPMACSRCGREGASVPDWKRHNRACDVPLSTKEEGTGKLNSLLGWVRKVNSGEGSQATESMTTMPTTPVIDIESAKRHATEAPGDIQLAKKAKTATSRSNNMMK